MLGLVIILLAVMPCWTFSGRSFLAEVPENVRQNFSLNLYRRMAMDTVLMDYVVSPAALHKFLIVVYDGANDMARYDLVDDLCVKAIDAKNFTLMSYAMFLHITREEAQQKFLENDFKNLSNYFQIENYIIATNVFNRSFKKTVQLYFDVKTVNRLRETEEFDALKEKFGELIDENAKFQLLNFITFDGNFRNSFELRDGKLFGVGDFRYGFQNSLRIIELPLESPSNEELVLQIYLPDNFKAFNDFIQQFGKDFDHMNKYDEKMNLKTLRVILPEMRFENVTDLGSYFKNHGTGVKRLLTEDNAMQYAFEDPKNAVKIDSFLQRAKVHINKDPPKEDENIAENTLDEKLAKIDQAFDATEKPFIFFIKSKELLYFVGTHYVA